MRDQEARFEIALIEENITEINPETGKRTFVNVPASIAKINTYMHDELPNYLIKVVEDFVNKGIDTIQKSIEASLLDTNKILADVNDTLEMISKEVDDHGGTITELRRRLDKQTRALKTLAEAI